MNKFKFEIEYEFVPVKDERPRIHWMYFSCEARTLASAKAKAEAHYKSQIASLGWGKYATLTEIRPPKRANEPLYTKPTDELSTARKSSGSDLKPKRRTTRRKPVAAKSAKPAASSKRKKSS